MKQSKKSIKKSNSSTSFRIKFQGQQPNMKAPIYDRLPNRRKTLESNQRVQQFPTKTKNESKMLNNQKQIQRLKDQIHLVTRVNESLQRQNQTLKKQVAFLNQISSSRRSSFYSKKASEDNGFKDKLLNRLNSKREGLITLDNQSTAMYSSKITSKIDDSIAQVFEDFSHRRTIPSMEHLFRISKKYFDEFKQNYVKLKVIFDHINRTPKTELSAKIEDLLCLFQVPILYKQNPRGLFRSISKQKMSQQRKPSKNRNKATNDSQEGKQLFQLFSVTESNLKIILKNSKLFQRFRTSQIFYKIIKKCRS